MDLTDRRIWIVHPKGMGWGWFHCIIQLQLEPFTFSLSLSLSASALASASLSPSRPCRLSIGGFSRPRDSFVRLAVHHCHLHVEPHPGRIFIFTLPSYGLGNGSRGKKGGVCGRGELGDGR
jgi:hypothetical protein